MLDWNGLVDECGWWDLFTRALHAHAVKNHSRSHTRVFLSTFVSTPLLCPSFGSYVASSSTTTTTTHSHMSPHQLRHCLIRAIYRCLLIRTTTHAQARNWRSILQIFRFAKKMV